MPRARRCSPSRSICTPRKSQKAAYFQIKLVANSRSPGHPASQRKAKASSQFIGIAHRRADCVARPSIKPSCSCVTDSGNPATQASLPARLSALSIARKTFGAQHTSCEVSNSHHTVDEAHILCHRETTSETSGHGSRDRTQSSPRGARLIAKSVLSPPNQGVTRNPRSRRCLPADWKRCGESGFCLGCRLIPAPVPGQQVSETLR